MSELANIIIGIVIIITIVMLAYQGSKTMKDEDVDQEDYF